MYIKEAVCTIAYVNFSSAAMSSAAIWKLMFVHMTSARRCSMRYYVPVTLRKEKNRPMPVRRSVTGKLRPATTQKHGSSLDLESRGASPAT